MGMRIPFFIILFTYHISFAQVKEMLYSGPPVFHGAQVVGNYPHTDFLFTVPATGERPLTFSADNLPSGLTIEPSTGIIRGRAGEKGTHIIKIHVSNAKGQATEDLRIEVGDMLCLTPPMGWNSWNVFTRDINEKMLMEMADAMVSTGMRDVGYQYINIDDFWHAAERDSLGNPVADPVKFPHGIKYLADYIHSKGLKLGIYSCAGDLTCGGCFGGYAHEAIDAKKYAEWGIDLLKYDYCHAPWSRKAAVERYTAMGTALKNSGRSIVFSVCEWGLRNPWLWAQQAGGSYWRTTPDIFDTWEGGSPWRMSLMKIVRRNQKRAKYAGPGHWNDPDMLLVGNYGKGKATSWNGHFKGLTDEEYRSHMALWCMFSAPLLASCDLRNMNETTASTLMDTIFIRVNQDALGTQARLYSRQKGVWVYQKRLKNDGKAILVFNTTSKTKTIFESDSIDNPFIFRTGRPDSRTSGKPRSFELKPHETTVFLLIPE